MGKTNPKYKQIEVELTKAAKEKPAKNPKVPTFNPASKATAQKLLEIIDAGGERAAMAYGALSRLGTLWTEGAITTDSQRNAVVNDLLRLVLRVFPDSEGLPEDPESP